MEPETLRAYATALGGYLDITVSVGPHSVKVAIKAGRIVLVTWTG